MRAAKIIQTELGQISEQTAAQTNRIASYGELLATLARELGGIVEHLDSATAADDLKHGSARLVLVASQVSTLALAVHARAGEISGLAWARRVVEDAENVSALPKTAMTA